MENNFKLKNHYRPAIQSCRTCKHFFDYGNKVPTFCTHPSLDGKTEDDINEEYVCDLFEYQNEIDKNVDEQ